MQNLNLRGTQKALNELKNLVLHIRLTYFTTKRAQCWWRRKLKNLLTTKLQKINNAYLHYFVQVAAIVPAKGKTGVCSLPMKIKFIATYPIYNRGVIWSLNNTLEFSFFALFQNFISYPWFKPQYSKHLLTLLKPLQILIKALHKTFVFFEIVSFFTLLWRILSHSGILKYSLSIIWLSKITVLATK